MAKKKDDVVENKRSCKMAYRLWLNDIVQSTSKPLNLYQQILAFLFKTEFKVLDEKDQNRIGDILGLRTTFSNESHLENADYIIIQQMPPSVMELMVTMAQRINDTISTDDNVARYFWDMMESLGIADMDDTKFSYSEAEKRINAFLMRQYCKNGKGGLFHIKTLTDSGYDATMTDIYTQAMVYVNSKR